MPHPEAIENGIMAMEDMEAEKAKHFCFYCTGRLKGYGLDGDSCHGCDRGWCENFCHMITNGDVPEDVMERTNREFNNWLDEMDRRDELQRRFCTNALQPIMFTEPDFKLNYHRPGSAWWDWWSGDDEIPF